MKMVQCVACAACLTSLYFPQLSSFLSLPGEEEFVHLVQRTYAWKPTTSCVAVQHLVKTFGRANTRRLAASVAADQLHCGCAGDKSVDLRGLCVLGVEKQPVRCWSLG